MTSRTIFKELNMIEYLPRQTERPFRVTFVSAGTHSKRRVSFASEEAAKIFEKAQQELAAREREILRRKRKRTKPESLTVNEVLDCYFACAPLREITKKQSSYHARHLRAAFGVRKADQLTPSDITAFSEAQKVLGVMQTTIARRISILRSALSFAVSRGSLAVHPLHGAMFPRGKSRRIDPPTLCEAQKIFEASPGHLKRVILLGLYAGPRIGPSELMRLRWCDIDLANGVIHMPNAAKGGNSDYRDIPVRRELLPYLTRWKSHDVQRGIDYVISWAGKKVRSIHGAWKRALIRAEITRRLTPYSLRHAFATNALASGADLGATAALMGHSDPSMILRVYQHVQESQKREVIEKLPMLTCEPDA